MTREFMKPVDRFREITKITEEQGFASVNELSKRLNVSEMTIRRDLDKLNSMRVIQRTYGGAVLIQTDNLIHQEEKPVGPSAIVGILTCHSDVLIAASYKPRFGLSVMRGGTKMDIPVISEAFPLPDTVTCVSIDNYEAGFTIGRWAGLFIKENLGGIANLLDLTYHLSNTVERSKGFIAGLGEIVPITETLSLNPQSRYELAYQLTRDALSVNKNINVIFSINDTNAWGAINACIDLNIDPAKMMVITFGLEGDTLKNALRGGNYCKGALAMFPEIVGPACVEAAIQAYNHKPLPELFITPYAVLDQDTLTDYYEFDGDGWHIKWNEVKNKFMSIKSYSAESHSGLSLPCCIGIILPFGEHEWYQNLVSSIQAYSQELGINFEIVDAEQTEKDDLEFRRRVIATRALQEIKTGDVIFLDGGSISNYMVEGMAEFDEITVITNSLPIFDAMKNYPNITLISTGGVLRRNSKALVGPTAENALRELRSDKLFLIVSGISFDFGLSHTNISDVTIKQTMIHSAREVILLADNTCFEQEAVVQIAPLKVIHKLITDDALPASIRLQLRKLGIDVIIAGV